MKDAFSTTSINNSCSLSTFALEAIHFGAHFSSPRPPNSQQRKNPHYSKRAFLPTQIHSIPREIEIKKKCFGAFCSWFRASLAVSAWLCDVLGVWGYYEKVVQYCLVKECQKSGTSVGSHTTTEKLSREPLTGAKSVAHSNRSAFSLQLNNPKIAERPNRGAFHSLLNWFSLKFSLSLSRYSPFSFPLVTHFLCRAFTNSAWDENLICAPNSNFPHSRTRPKLPSTKAVERTKKAIVNCIGFMECMILALANSSNVYFFYYLYLVKK